MANSILDIADIESEDEPPVMDLVLPDSDAALRADGWRLHVFRQYNDDNIFVAHERVLPEKVADPRAHRVFDSRRVLLHPQEARWLYERLGELLAADKNGGR